MERINIELPENLRFLRAVSNVNWTILIGKLIQSEISKMQEMQEIVAESRLTEQDVEELTEKINKSLSTRY